MNLYLISQNKNTGYDTYDSAVVAAKSEEEARYISPNHDGRDRWMPEEDEWYLSNSSWARPEQVTVELIGRAIDGTEKGVIVASFNAG